MKIAVCLSGHVRTFERTYNAFKENVLDKYDCDVFISTWNNTGNVLYHANYISGFDEKDTTINLDKINELYKPKKIVIDSAFSDKIKNIKLPYVELKTRNGADVSQVVTMFYKMWDCNNLKKSYEKENSITYDVTFRCRFDAYIKSFSAELARERVQFIPGHMGFNDIVFAGSNSYMNDIFDIYTIFSKDIPFNSFENAENLLYHHIIGNSIPFDDNSSCIKYLFVKPQGVYDCNGNKFCELSELK